MKSKNLCLCALAILLVVNQLTLGQVQNSGTITPRELTRSLLNAKSPQERADLLAAHTALVTVGLRRWLISEGTTFLAEGKYAEAINAFDIAKSVSEQIKDDAGIGTASLNTGTVLYLQGNYDGALAKYQEARAIFAKIKDQLELARALMGIGLVYKEQGKLAEGLDYLKQSQREFEALGTPASLDEVADVLNAIASIYHSQGNYSEAVKTLESSQARRSDPQSMLRIGEAFYSQGNYLQALEYYEKVAKQLESGPDKSGPGLDVAVFGNLANVYYRLGNYDLSLKYYQQNLALLEKLADKSGIALTLEGVGNVYRQQGDFGAALDNYLLSVKSAAESGGRVSPATALGSIGLIRAAQGNTAEALEYFGKSLNEFEQRGDKVGMARALVNIGNSSYTLGDFPRALDVFQKALVLREAMDDKSGMADVLLGIGTTYSAQRNLTPALEALRRALSIQEQLKDNERIARVLKEMAKCFSLQNDAAQALVFIERAITAATQVGSRDLQWRTNLDKGKYNQTLDHPVEARQAFEESIRQLEELQASSCTNFMDPTAPLEVTEPYAELVRLLVDDGKAEEAFLSAERGKAQAFRSIFRKDELRINKSLTPAEKEEEQRTFTSLLALEIESARERQRRVTDEKAVAAVKSRTSQAQMACVNLRKGLYLRHPQLRTHRGELPRLKNVVDAGSFIADANTAFLEFLVTDTTTYLFVLTRDATSANTGDGQTSRKRTNRAALRLQVYPIQVQRNDVATRVAGFRQSIANQDQNISESARQLYDLLLKPAEQLLQNKSNIIIAPDRELWALPFQALQPVENRYLIEQSAISYTPSVTVTSVVGKPQLPRTRRAGPTSELVTFVNPTVSGAIARRIELTSGSATVVSVPEPKANTAVASAKTLSGANAREDSAQQAFLNYRLINFATTTVIDDANPLTSYSVLATSPENNVDGLLQARETMQLNSVAQVAMMPFASPARKQIDVGSGVTAMAWSWFVAGTPTTIISQWPGAPDRTMDLIEKFRDQISGRRAAQTSKAAALQTATRSYMQANPENRHPYYWSGLRLVGNSK